MLLEQEPKLELQPQFWQQFIMELLEHVVLLMIENMGLKNKEKKCSVPAIFRSSFSLYNL